MCSYCHFSCNSSWEHSREIDVENIYLYFLLHEAEQSWAGPSTILMRVGKWFCRTSKPIPSNSQPFPCRAWCPALEGRFWAACSGGFPGTCGTAGGACPTCWCGAPAAATSRCVGGAGVSGLGAFPAVKPRAVSPHKWWFPVGGAGAAARPPGPREQCGIVGVKGPGEQRPSAGLGLMVM